MSRKQFVFAITGASGAIYATRTLEVLLAAGHDVHLAISPSAALVIKQELNRTVDVNKFAAKDLGLADAVLSGDAAGRLHYYQYQDLFAPIASGSFLTHGMVICPCSGSTLGAVVHATGENLIHRAADVHLKERRKLVLVPRETPLSTIQLDNMKRASEAGAVVLPAMPGFYHGATTIADLVDFVVARICDQLGVEHQLMRRWGS